MWQTTDARAAAGGRTLQYHGKWPFVRVLGVQEQSYPNPNLALTLA